MNIPSEVTTFQGQNKVTRTNALYSIFPTLDPNYIIFCKEMM